MCFFFFKQKTAYEMRISDWSSDVCSSDLETPHDAIDRHLDQAVDDTQADIGPGDLRVEPAAHAPGRERDRDGVKDRRLFHQMVIIVRLPLHIGGQHVVEPLAGPARSEERSVGKAGVSTCRSRWEPEH